ncbi:MmgE/PrpD family protein [Segeticoccus rhizosphaerae]|uniref:MmgE/PrpD family protein n=1 Tax=Segeticoccus rhizosphaerae TaxID=1104777 RepID=UPI0010C14EAC|nr:MmgE/PrpD family protein [Ornithinicoccus soli]
MNASTKPTMQLAEYACQLTFDDIPEAVITKQILHLLDGIGNALYGVSTEFGEKVRCIAANSRAVPDARVWGTSLRTSVEIASAANASFANINELEDAHHRTKFKPNTILVPAVLTVADVAGSSGAEVLTAIVAGTEVGIRVGESIHSASDAYKRGWLGTGALGPLATAASLANLLHLSPMETAHALALGANMPTGIWASGLTPAKRVMIGRAAANGVAAVDMARAGITAGPEVLSPGWGSFGNVLSGITDTALLTDRLGQHWKTAEVGLEWYPTKGALHSSIDAILQIYSKHQIDPRDIRTVQVATARSIVDNPALGEYPPEDIWSAQHSLRYCLAVTLLEKGCSGEQFRASLLGSPVVNEMASRIAVVEDRLATELYPKTKTAIVEITLDGGGTFSERVDYCTGEPENFPTEAQIVDKFDRAAGQLIADPNRLADIVEKVRALPDAHDVSDLIRSISPSATNGV